MSVDLTPAKTLFRRETAGEASDPAASAEFVAFNTPASQALERETRG